MDTLELLKSIKKEQELGGDKGVNTDKYSSDLSDSDFNNNENVNTSTLVPVQNSPVAEYDITKIIIDDVRIRGKNLMCRKRKGTCWKRKWITRKSNWNRTNHLERERERHQAISR